MEFVSGHEFLDYLRESPSDVDRIFEGVVDGLAHLQSREVLHRDIRPANILVVANGVPKNIDFGFGKTVGTDLVKEEAKSISLNWWCDTPPEFSEGMNDYQTEVYFVGKLFELALTELGLTEFKYRFLLGTMCDPERKRRETSFQEVQSKIHKGKFDELEFTPDEIRHYREFAGQLLGVVASIQSDSRFERDSSKILAKLEDLYRKTMLEATLAMPNRLV